MLSALSAGCRMPAAPLNNAFDSPSPLIHSITTLLHRSTGGTLIECQRLLATQGAAHVSAYVTHGVFPNESWRRFEGEKGNGATDGFK